jgi:hypothetical protein
LLALAVVVRDGVAPTLGCALVVDFPVEAAGCFLFDEVACKTAFSATTSSRIAARVTLNAIETRRL